MKISLRQGSREGAVAGRMFEDGLPMALVMAALLLGSPLHADELRGSVTDSLGQPVANADFDVFDAAGEKLPASDNTDAFGQYRLTLAPGRYSVLVQPAIGSGFAPRELEGIVVAGVTTLDWRLAPAFRQLGRVRDAAGRPVVAARMEFDRLSDGIRVPSLGNTSSPFGTFAAYVEWGTFAVTATPPESTGLAPARIASWTMPGPDTLAFSLVTASRLAGVIRDPAGAGVPDVRLAFNNASDGVRVPSAENRSGADGAFRARVAPGVYSVVVEPARGGRLCATRIANVDLGASAALDITLQSGVLFGGRITDRDGAPLEGADWDVATEATGTSVPTPGDNTDADGRFALVLPAGEYRLTLSPPAGSGLDTLVFRNVGVSADTTFDWTYGTTGPPPPPVALQLAPLGNPTYLPARVRLALPETGFVRAELYDVTGRRVRVLADATLPAGTRDLVWDGRTDQGVRANAGVYFVRVQAGARSGITRLVLLAQPPTY